MPLPVALCASDPCQLYCITNLALRVGARDAVSLPTCDDDHVMSLTLSLIYSNAIRLSHAEMSDAASSAHLAASIECKTPAAILERLEVGQVASDSDIVLEVAITARRVRGSGLAFFSGTVVSDDPASCSEVQLVLEMRKWGGSSDRFDAVVELMRPGAIVNCAGSPGCDRPGQLSLYVTCVTLRAIAFDCGSAPCSISRLARCVKGGCIAAGEAAAALRCDEAVILDLVRLTNEAAVAGVSGDDGARAAAGVRLKRAVAALARSAAGLPPGRTAPRHRPPSHSSQDLAILAAAEAATVPFPTATPPVALPPLLPLLHPAAHLASDLSAACARQSAAVRTRGEYLHVKKAPQIAWVLGQLAALLGRLGRPPPYRLLDGCGGRGDLAIAVAAALPACSVAVVDVNAQALDAGRARAAAAGIAVERVSFVCADIAEWVAAAGERCDVVLGLHACGGLSDTLLAAATRLRCAFLVVPCCYGKHGGGDREGWARPLAMPGDESGTLAAAVLCRLAESPDRAISVRAQRAVAALRLASVQRALVPCGTGESPEGASGPGGPRRCQWRLELATFDESASLRNLALIGAPHPVAPLEPEAL